MTKHEIALTETEIEAGIVAALNRRAENGQHLHHSGCIHNLSPEDQVEARGKTVEWWTQMIGALPIQITPAEWETDPLEIDGRAR